MRKLGTNGGDIVSLCIHRVDGYELHTLSFTQFDCFIADKHASNCNVTIVDTPLTISTVLR